MRKQSLCLVLLLPLLVSTRSSPARTLTLSTSPTPLPIHRYIIQFADKKNTPYTLGNPSAYLSAAALQRRMRQHIPLDSIDLPIPPAYLDSLRSQPAIRILNVSRWLNQALIATTDTGALAIISAFSFVKKTTLLAGPITTLYHPAGTGINQTGGLTAVSSPGKDILASRKSPTGNLLNYGSSYAQIHIHNGEYLHNRGFTGNGITIAILDDGFYGYLNNPAFDSIRWNQQVLGSWDFVNAKPGVNEEDVHGMYCFSIIAANRPGFQIGSAPKAKFWLFKTEDTRSESLVEEQNWAAAAEFADSAGVDIISSSLGYIHFDDSTKDHTYLDRNGHTSLITQAANLAAAKGMIVTVSAGNNGEETNDSRYISCPGDADSALTIGATNVNGLISPFSSWGPNSSGRIKPDVVSVGQGIVIASVDGSPTGGSGTSFSNPNMAGLVACLWQAFPEFTNYEILNAVRKSSARYMQPDERYGYGIPDFYKAYELLQTARAIRLISSRGTQWISAFPVPYTDNFTVVFKAQNEGYSNLSLLDAMGRTLGKKSVFTGTGQWYSINFEASPLLPAGVYFIHYDDGKIKTTLKVVKK